MAEWLKAHAWKACLLERVTWVRIPLSPPASLNCRETAPPFAAKYAKPARISRYFVRKADWRERTVRDRMASICWPFSGGHKRSPVSVDLIRRMQCDHEPMTGRRRLDLVKPLDAVRLCLSKSCKYLRGG